MARGGTTAIASLLAVTLLAAGPLAFSGAVWPEEEEPTGSDGATFSGVVWSAQAKLMGPDGAAFDNFGFSVDIDHDTALVGAPFGDRDVTLDTGAAYVFVRDPSTGFWFVQAKLTASDGAALDQFGFSVAIDSDTALVGAPFDDGVGGEDTGAAYVFVRDPSTGFWFEQAKLTAFDGAAFDAFGFSVAIHGDTALVGVPVGDTDVLRPDTGAAYVFIRDPSTGFWFVQAKLTANDGAMFDGFGWSVALDGVTALVGSPFDDRGTSEEDFGAAYVFVWSPATGKWEQQAKLTPSDAAASDEFGRSVAISGDTALVGAPFHDEDPLVGNAEGSAYVFIRIPWMGVWLEQAKLMASDEAAQQWFGFSVAIHGDTALVGAVGDDSFTGAAYVFVRDPSTGFWFEQTKLAAFDRAADDSFGHAVAIHWDTALVGAPFDDNDNGSDAGATYVFVRVPCC